MNFKVSKHVFLDGLNLAAKAISANTPLPALSGIKIIAENDQLTLISSDSNISIRTVIDNASGKVLTIEEDGDIVIDNKYILEIVRKIDSETVSVEIIDGNFVKIYGANSEFKINGMSAADYPNINFDTNTEPFTLKLDLFREIVEGTAFACSDKDTRPVLMGVNFKADGRKLIVNATDSYRLAYKAADLDQDLHFDITVPAVYLNSVIHSISEEETISIAIDSQKISFLSKNSIIQTRLLDDSFPDTSRLIPSSFSQILMVSSRELNGAIDRSSFIKSDGKNIIKMSISKDKVDISAANQIGSSFETIHVIDFEGDPFEISCSGKYLQDAIKACGCDVVTISFSGELRPMILTNGNDRNSIQLISPVRTYK